MIHLQIMCVENTRVPWFSCQCTNTLKACYISNIFSKTPKRTSASQMQARPEGEIRGVFGDCKVWSMVLFIMCIIIRLLCHSWKWYDSSVCFQPTYLMCSCFSLDASLLPTPASLVCWICSQRHLRRHHPDQAVLLLALWATFLTCPQPLKVLDTCWYPLSAPLAASRLPGRV